MVFPWNWESAGSKDGAPKDGALELLQVGLGGGGFEILGRDWVSLCERVF